MEKRIIALGPKSRKSFMVTLPIDWVKEHKLEIKRVIEMNLVGETIILSQIKNDPERIVLDASIVTYSLGRIIQIWYKKGIDEIKIMNITPREMNKMNTLIEQRCMGFALISQDKDHCIIKDITKESTEDFNTLLRRVFLIILQMTEEEDKENIENLDKNLNKITAYCHRLLIKKGYHEFQNIIYYARLCSELEHFGDSYKRQFERKKRMTKEEISLIKDLYALFYKFKVESADQIQKRIHDLMQDEGQ